VTGRETGSAIIDPSGRQLALNLNLEGEQAILVGDVSLGSGNAPYTSLGDWLGWLLLAGWVFFIVYQSTVERRAKKALNKQIHNK
jgi:apolipoprotein N-acyltransferase